MPIGAGLQLPVLVRSPGIAAGGPSALYDPDGRWTDSLGHRTPASQRFTGCLLVRRWIMVGLSMDLRERVVAAVDAGMAQKQAAERFAVSLTSVERYLARRRATGSLAPTVQRHGPLPVKRARLQAWLPARLEAARDATLAEHAAAFADQTGMSVSLATMCRAIAGLPPEPGAELTPSGRRRRGGRPLKQKA
jgi:transposase